MFKHRCTLHFSHNTWLRPVQPGFLQRPASFLPSWIGMWSVLSNLISDGGRISTVTLVDFLAGDFDRRSLGHILQGKFFIRKLLLAREVFFLDVEGIRSAWAPSPEWPVKETIRKKFILQTLFHTYGELLHSTIFHGKACSHIANLRVPIIFRHLKVSQTLAMLMEISE